ncbi:hypothetical protein HAZT_HAZT002364 [Hyalella azteca]|nr:hypothetical protein HAZT_HAZT002364 [Hyalella azteca]
MVAVKETSSSSSERPLAGSVLPDESKQCQSESGSLTKAVHADDADRRDLTEPRNIGADPAGDCKDREKKDCLDCRNCQCHKGCASESIKRRCSTSDIASILAANPFPLKKTLTSGKSLEKIDRINLANLVFNPNFKNSAGCVNLPVIRAGQNLAQKNAQRSTSKDVNNNLPDLNQQAAMDLLAQQLQPQSLDKLNVKLQQLARQRRLGSGSASDLDTGNDVSDLLQSLAAKNSGPNQNNALRYKTELCRSYEEGGECRFGAACTFAHGPEELRPVPRHPLYKTEFCRTYHQHGYCQYGTRCHFIHDIEEADRSAPLRGCKSWGRHDKLSGALLSLASSSGLLDSDGKQVSPSENDVLLANLRRLYALRMMNCQEKQAQDLNSHFSMSQPMAHQLALAHQQLTSGAPQHLPLSMTQPLPMEALQMGLQRAGQRASHMVSNNRIDSLASDYSGWSMAPSSPSYPGLSPFGSYQQFSPLPHHQAQAYQQYPFSATAPDLSAALANSNPYGMSQQSFANTVNVAHMLPEHAYANVNKGASNGNSAPVQMPNQVWPATSSEVPSVIDKELFGFGLESQNQNGAPSYPGYPQHQYYQSNANYGKQSSSNITGVYGEPSSKQRSSEPDLLSLINKSDKYMSDSKGLKTINEVSEPRDQSVRPKSSLKHHHHMNVMNSMS